MGDTSFIKYNHRILSINKGNTPDILTESITVPSFRGYQAGEVIPAGTKLIDIITKEFKSSAPTHTITVQVVGQGSTSPAAGSHSVVEGNSFTMTSATPASGWNLDSVKLNGASVTLPNTISNVTGDHTFVVTFTEIPVVNKYRITGAVDGGHGSIAPTNAGEFDEGTAVEAKTFNATPDSGYVVDKWTVNGATQIEMGNSFTLPAISAINKNYEVKVKFKVAPAETYTVSITDNTSGLSGYGTITPAAGTHSEDVGTATTVTVTPNSGFKIKTLTLDGVDQTSPFTINGVKDQTYNVVVEFEEVKEQLYSGYLQRSRAEGAKQTDPVESEITLGDPIDIDPIAIKSTGYTLTTPPVTGLKYTQPCVLYPVSIGAPTSIKQSGQETIATWYNSTITIGGVTYHMLYKNSLITTGQATYEITW